MKDHGREGYSGLQIALHWVMALLILGAWILSDGMGRVLELKEDGDFEGLPLHVVIGLAVLALLPVRALFRRAKGAPGAVPGSTPAMARARHWGHRLLYLMMLVVPLGGAAAWFAGLPTGDVHELAGTALLLLAAGHAILALWHQAKGEGVLTRMVLPRD